LPNPTKPSSGLPIRGLNWTLLLRDRQRIGVEFKRADAPGVTASMRIALSDLRLDALYVVYPGLHRSRLAEGVEAMPLGALVDQG
jgi:hypothetical protein